MTLNDYEVELSIQVVGTIKIKAETPEAAAKVAERIHDPNRLEMPTIDSDPLTVTDNTGKIVWEA